MQKVFHSAAQVFSDPRKRLSLVWILGLVLGTLLAAGQEASLFSLMRPFCFRRVSIVLSLVWAVLPFLITAYAVWIHRPEILFGVLFCKGFSFAAVAFSLQAVFQGAGWLLQPMVQFSEALLLPVLLWYCRKHCQENEDSAVRDHMICISICVVAVGINHIWILPYGAELINHLSGR